MTPLILLNMQAMEEAIDAEPQGYESYGFGSRSWI